MALNKEQLEVVYEMMGHPGWNLLMEDLEEMLGTAIMAILGLRQDDPGYGAKAAYWTGRIHTLWAIGRMESEMGTSLRQNAEAETAPSDGVIRRIVKKLLGR